MTATRLANNLVVPTSLSTSPALTQALNMSGANALNVQLTVLSGGGASNTLTVSALGSDDLENWTSTGITGSMSVANAQAGSTQSAQFTTFGYAYARLFLSVGGTPAVTVVAIDCNTYLN